MSSRASLAVAALCLVLGCTRTPGAAVFHADHPNIHYTGWFDTRIARAPRFAWPGSQISARFTGSSVRIRLTDTPVADDTRETDWITIVIDDQPARTLALAEGTHVYPLAQNLASGEHRVLLWKRTEAEVGVITFHGLTLDAAGSLTRDLKPTRRRMMFVGDSITAGYGNEGRDANCHWSAARENNFETYGAYAARALSAEYVAMAWSGKGVTRNYEPRDRLTLPELYERVIPSENDSPRISSAHADVVVVNLGTNDFFQGAPDEAAFTRTYTDLLGALRTRYPRAFFVLGLGPMLADDYPQPNARSLLRKWLESARAQRRAAGDAKVELIELWIDPAEGIGCDFHPNTKTHARLGRELADLLRARLGW